MCIIIGLSPKTVSTLTNKQSFETNSTKNLTERAPRARTVNRVWQDLNQLTRKNTCKLRLTSPRFRCSL